MEPDWKKMDGLIPVIVQDAATRDVLTLAYMNEEALQKTRSTGQMHYWSRSRNRLWRKGEESGNVQRLRSLSLDCDGDAFLVQVEQTGVACHTGQATCFHNPLDGHSPAMAKLWATILDRKANPKEGSYTNSLLDDQNKRLKKIAEEAAEVIMACVQGDREHAIREFTDLQYMAWVAMAAMDISPGDIAAEVARRAKPGNP